MQLSLGLIPACWHCRGTHISKQSCSTFCVQLCLNICQILSLSDGNNAEEFAGDCISHNQRFTHTVHMHSMYLWSESYDIPIRFQMAIDGSSLRHVHTTHSTVGAELRFMNHYYFCSHCLNRWAQCRLNSKDAKWNNNEVTHSKLAFAWGFLMIFFNINK